MMRGSARGRRSTLTSTTDRENDIDAPELPFFPPPDKAPPSSSEPFPHSEIIAPFCLVLQMLMQKTKQKPFGK